MKKIFLLLLALVCIPLILAQNQQYHLKLLAVQENGNGTLSGSDADLFLEIQEGSGRVFLETFPLTKLDTQISTRFAKDAACHHFKLDCDQYDFIYTIKAKSSIIGGPSAGAAIAALTSIAVLDLPYDDTSTTVTGTINSGGIIGPVGGIKQKLEAASQAKLKKVLIPQGTAKDGFGLQDENRSESDKNAPYQNNESSSKKDTNLSLNLIRYGKENLSLEVMEVSSLDEVVFQLTGKQLNHKNVTIIENKVYGEIMQGLQQVLCNRREGLQKEFDDVIKEDAKISIQENSENTTPKNATPETKSYAANGTTIFVQQKFQQAENASRLGDYYSAASFCFTANIRLKTDTYLQRNSQKNLSRESYTSLFTALEKKNTALQEKINQEKITTIADLQTLMIVQERLQDVREQIKTAALPETLIEELPPLLAYGEERLFSAVAWMQFFSMDGKSFVLDETHLQESCTQKIAEAEERYQYVSLFLGEGFLGNLQKKIDNAKIAQEQKIYPLCLITAAQAKADANAILSSLGVQEDAISELFVSKKMAVERIIAENSAEDTFPILGYSYYRYAAALAEQEKYTALVYLEYALEMSDLGMYFPEEKHFLQQQKKLRKLLNDEQVFIFIAGVLLGVAGTLLLKKKKKSKSSSHL
ncbi:hypothetical protein HYX13_01855 [Candidatus Woesearchaeota archaeon]|nr:hypothetical protein [Candidatus Woesearchaeota archaeon]